jgi:hypothetical protein
MAAKQTDQEGLICYFYNPRGPSCLLETVRASGQPCRPEWCVQIVRDIESGISDDEWPERRQELEGVFASLWADPEKLALPDKLKAPSYTYRDPELCVEPPFLTETDCERLADSQFKIGQKTGVELVISPKNESVCFARQDSRCIFTRIDANGIASYCLLELYGFAPPESCSNRSALVQPVKRYVVPVGLTVKEVR